MIIPTTTKGFTLVELMLVVVIVGIFASIAIPTYSDYVIQSQVTEAQTLFEGAKVSYEIEHSKGNDGVIPILAGQYVLGVAVVGKNIVVTFGGNKVSKKLAGKQITYYPYVLGTTGDSNSTIIWVCSHYSRLLDANISQLKEAIQRTSVGTTVAKEYLPSTCTS